MNQRSYDKLVLVRVADSLEHEQEEERGRARYRPPQHRPAPAPPGTAPHTSAGVLSITLHMHSIFYCVQSKSLDVPFGSLHIDIMNAWNCAWYSVFYMHRAE